MFIVSLINFNKDLYASWWVDSINGNSKDVIFLVDNRWNFDNKLSSYVEKNFYVIPKEIESKLLDKFGSNSSLENAKNYEDIYELKHYFNTILLDISQKYEIDAVYAMVECKSLQTVCYERGLYYKSFENAPIRTATYSEKSFVWFMDQSISNSCEEGKERLNRFIKDIDQLIIDEPVCNLALLLWFSKPEGMHRIVKTYLCNDSDKIGVALPAPRNEINRGWTAEKILLYLDEEENVLFNDVLIREHPGYTDFYDKRLVETEDILDFFSLIGTVVSAGSSVTAEALLFERNAADLTNTFYCPNHLKNTLGEKNKWLVNFMVFNMWLPLELMFDSEYIEWRKSKPSESEIFNKNLKYIVNNLQLDGCKDIYDWKSVYDYRCCSLKSDRSELIQNMSRIISINWEEKNVFICGIGADSKAIKKILCKMGAKIIGYLVMDNNDIKIFDNLNVYKWNTIKQDPEKYYVITQRYYAVQKDVLIELIESGMKNILII